MADCALRRRCLPREHTALLVELHPMPSWNHLVFMRATRSILSPNKGWEIPWCLDESGRREGSSHYESRFHSNPNIAAMKFELRWETGAKLPSII